MIPQPPRAPRKPYTHRIHGHERKDPFHWLCDRDEDGVRAYLSAENDYTKAVLGNTQDLQDRLFEEFVGRMEEEEESVPYREGDFLYFWRLRKGSEHRVYYRKRPGGEDETVLADGESLSAGRPGFSLGDLEVSPDGRLLALTVDEDGNECYRLSVRDLETGNDYPQSVYPVADGVAWGSDNRTLYYVEPEPETLRDYRLYRYHIDTGEKELLFEERDAAFDLSVGASLSGAYVFLASVSMETTEYRYLEAADVTGVFRILRKRRPGIRSYPEHWGSHFVFLTNEGAVDFRVTAVSTEKPDGPEWEVLPHSDGVHLTEMIAFADFLVVFEREEGLDRIRVLDRAGDCVRLIGFPGDAYVIEDEDNCEYTCGTLRVRYASPVNPDELYEIDLASGEFSLLKRLKIPSGFPLGDYGVSRYWVPVADGAKVPVTVVSRKNLPLDGTSPCCVSGYGSYGEVSEPDFSIVQLSLLERGFILVTAHVRGGGLLGERWHEAGKRERKLNTFEDFISCVEFLHAKGFSTPQRTVIYGASAGGLLVGVVINRRPELMRVAVAEVPFVDIVSTMLDETLPLTVSEYEEWGNPEEAKEVYERLLSYSPYDNLARREYPHLLMTSALNDMRVGFWEPAKFVAKGRRFWPENRLLLLRTEMDSGHSGASGRYQGLRETAVIYAFMLMALEMPD